ncbi:type VII secretion protein EccB [Mycobacterium botniense]|uniref:Type VII secretion protein EccB n=1 Tax=Mycobacterium botniense TaxID=84962 RepID=A0A7I9XUS6_9MYCO|nr:type VII secretion protein EccB [Mycobacterium botniense]GFG73057.1 type VII secretion protein EccB [Mycobacterium botniense]
MARHSATRLQLSGYRFLMRRMECALLRADLCTVHEPVRAPALSLAAGGVLTLVIVIGCAALAVLRPQAALGNAPIVMDHQSGALYVRVGDTVHPVLNLASARLIAGTAADPQPVSESELRRTPRGPLLGIPGAPQLLAPPVGEPAWTICDTDHRASAVTTVIAGTRPGPPARRLSAQQSLLVASGPGAPVYLLYNGHRAVVNLSDLTVVRALRLESVAPHSVSRIFLNTVPEAPPIEAPRIPGAGGHGPAKLSGFPVGSVLRVARADRDEYFVVFSTGVQRIGALAADLIRLSDSQATHTIIAVAPDVISSSPAVDVLPMATFPDQAPTPAERDATTLCVTWAPAPSGGSGISFSAGSGLPLPAGQIPVTLAQADAGGPAVDAVYLPPGRSAYVYAAALTGDYLRAATRYLVTDTGVRFPIHDDQAAHDLGLPATAVPAPWPLLASLPCGPELRRDNASAGWDAVVPGATGAPHRPHPR